MILLFQIEGFGNNVQFCCYYKSERNNFMRKKLFKNVSSTSFTVIQFSNFVFTEFKLDTDISYFIPDYVYQVCSVEVLSIVTVLEGSFK